jgi:endonuclease YncB( thermonuclease family)
MKRRWILLLLGLLSLSSPVEAKQWRTYEDCKLIPNDANDGDSFHVRYKDREYLFRLYFVDCPESDNSLPERVTEQAAYFGIDEKAAVQIGKQAKKFTEKFLADGFTVYSQLVDARGRSEMDRDYAVVNVGDNDLAVELVRNGLARIYGMGVDQEDGTSEKNVWWRLKSAEREAKKAKAGAWGIAPASTSQPEAQMPEQPRLVEHDFVTSRVVPVFSLQDTNRLVGHLQSGARIRILKEEPMNMVRIQFSAGSNKVYEAQCRRTDLGI